MDLILLIKAFFLGIIEGLTEFLPISSTGHLIVTGSLLDFHGASVNSFNIFIQLGAIFAICWEYRTKLSATAQNITRDPNARHLVINLILGFLPISIIAFLFIKPIKFYLFNSSTVAWALIIGGLIILLVEKKKPAVKISSVDKISPLDALKIGFAQCLSLIPGTSRSGATIMGAMVFGLERKTATEFSFFLAIPVMFIAVFTDLYKNWSIITAQDVPVFAIGFITAFLSALMAVKVLLKFIATHTFTAFAWYRIALGSIILLYKL